MQTYKKVFLGLLTVLGLTLLVVMALITYMQREPQFGGDFEVTYRGEPWRFAPNSKKLNLLYIGYKNCPDVCPMALSYTSQAIKQLSEQERKQVQVLFLSVDHEHDDPQDVAQYASQFYPDFLGLSGSREQIEQAVSVFKASYIVEENKKSYLGYSISHTDRIYFLNSKGIVLKMISSPRDSDLILQYIKEIL